MATSKDTWSKWDEANVAWSILLILSVIFTALAAALGSSYLLWFILFATFCAVVQLILLVLVFVKA